MRTNAASLRQHSNKMATIWSTFAWPGAQASDAPLVSESPPQILQIRAARNFARAAAHGIPSVAAIAANVRLAPGRYPKQSAWKDWLTGAISSGGIWDNLVSSTKDTW